MSNKFHIIIPARYHSTRFPAKLLAPLAGKFVLQHTYERACDVGAASVTIATDHGEIYDAMTALGARVIMTKEQHPTGTDRLAEAVDHLKLSDDDIVINLQGDEPLLPGSLLKKVANNLAYHSRAAIATLCEIMTHQDDVFNSNMVKVVMDHEGFALYFSRAPIPWQRDFFERQKLQATTQSIWFRHIGIYGYRVHFLRAYANLQPTILEDIEKLEQLRALYYGYAVHVEITAQKFPDGINTPEDLIRVEKIMATL